MSGAQFFWRITLLEGSGQEGKYRLEIHLISKGEPRPDIVPYREASPRMSYDALIGGLFGCVRQPIGKRLLELSPEDPTAEFYHDHHMAI